MTVNDSEYATRTTVNSKKNSEHVCNFLILIAYFYYTVNYTYILLLICTILVIIQF
uniref:Uncharacterized protein n=1 Tax=Kalanchoe fedtschenkoi TaxID=63787 RepID=A0A7N0U662_KALFE